jgi:hypothetical protein
LDAAVVRLERRAARPLLRLDPLAAWRVGLWIGGAEETLDEKYPAAALGEAPFREAGADYAEVLKQPVTAEHVAGPEHVAAGHRSSSRPR